MSTANGNRQLPVFPGSTREIQPATWNDALFVQMIWSVEDLVAEVQGLRQDLAAPPRPPNGELRGVADVETRANLQEVAT